MNDEYSQKPVYVDRFTGKRVDKLSDLLPSQTEEKCEHCGTNLINRCPRCGAPVCCPKCCMEAL